METNILTERATVQGENQKDLCQPPGLLPDIRIVIKLRHSLSLSFPIYKIQIAINSFKHLGDV